MNQRNSVPAVDILPCIGQGKASLSRTIRRRSTECVIRYKPKFDSPVVGGPTHGNVKRLIMLFEELKKNKENEHLHPRPSVRTESKCLDSYCTTTEWNQKRVSSQEVVYPKPETNSIIKTTNYKSFGLEDSSQNSVEFINDSLQARKMVFKMLVINYNGDWNFESEPNLEDEEAGTPSIVISKN